MTKTPHLVEMVRKLDARAYRTNGYVTEVPELIDILSELTPLLSVAILQHDVPDRPDMVAIEVKMGFTLNRAELEES